jgi:hypothetical protein
VLFLALGSEEKVFFECFYPARRYFGVFFLGGFSGVMVWLFRKYF